MYRRIAFAAADLSLAVGGVLLVRGFVRPHADVQRLDGVLLGFAAILVASGQLAGAMNVPAAAGQTGWRRLRPRWPVIMGVVVIAVITAGIGMAAAAITSPDPQFRIRARARAHARVRPSTCSRYGASHDRS